MSDVAEPHIHPTSIGQKFLEAFKKASPLLAVLSVALAVSEAVVIWYVLVIASPRHADLMKRIDVEMHCNVRWADLFKQRLDIERMSQDPKGRVLPLAVAEYYRQFWSLQEDQFYYYNQGFLPEGLYIDWIYERVKAFQNNNAVGGVHFIDGWEKHGKPITKAARNFVDFVEEIKRHKDDERFDEDGMKEILHNYRANFME